MDWINALTLILPIIASIIGGLVAYRFSEENRESAIRSLDVLKNTQQEIRNKIESPALIPKAKLFDLIKKKVKWSF